MRPSLALLVACFGLACGPEEPGPTPTVFIDAGVVPTYARMLPSCESACRRLQQFHCPDTSVPEGDCRQLCKHEDGVRKLEADPGCVVRAESCADVAKCQGR